MAEHFDKLWFQSSQNRLATTRAVNAIELTGKALPCRVVSVSGSFVTVAFEVQATGVTLPQVTMQKAESQWIRFPIQVGEHGLAVPSDAHLGGISGLGTGTAQLTQRQGNLATLLFVPVGSKSFPTVNTNMAYIAGPEGVIAQTKDGTASVTVSESGITIKFGGKSWTFNSSGFTMSSGIVAETHLHPYIPGSGSQTDTGEPVG